MTTEIKPLSAFGPLSDFPGELIYKAKGDWFFVLGSWAHESACARRKYAIKKVKMKGGWW